MTERDMKNFQLVGINFHQEKFTFIHILLGTEYQREWHFGIVKQATCSRVRVLLHLLLKEKI